MSFFIAYPIRKPATPNMPRDANSDISTDILSKLAVINLFDMMI
ncbi:MAG TPA: hypothetical protein VK487_03835 [Candidatus Bathyarchaeia archaeon]|nr:hypothetical protein [Candidatus Bathyarchaeia archaeon]